MKEPAIIDNRKNISFLQAIIPVITMAAFILLAVLVWKVPIHLAIFFELIVTLSIALYWGYRWDKLEEMLFSGFKNIGQVILILLLIGMLIGIWIESGTVPTLIYYGIKIINPHYFLILVFLITAVISMSIGTAVGTASTIGLALIIIGRGLNFPLPVVAGAIISGCYVGDRMSPVSSIANLTAFSAGVKIDELIKHMAYTILPPFIITLLINLVLGFYYLPDTIATDHAGPLTAGLNSNFTISPLFLIPPVLIILLSIFKIPTIPNLILSILTSMGLGVAIGDKSGMQLMMSMFHGYQGHTGYDLLDNLLSRGGMTGMLELIALIILAVLLGGLFEELGILQTILRSFMKGISSKGQLVIMTMVSSIITAMLSCNQLLAVYLPGRMMGQKFDELQVPRKDLGRALGDSGLILSPMIPWNINGLMMTGILGVSTLNYFPFAFLPLLLPLSSFFFALKSNHPGRKKTAV